MAEAEKKVNYTPEMTAAIIEQYEQGISLEQIAETIGKTVRSVRSKLVREGVYVAQEKAPARKAEGPTKKEILKALDETGFNTQGFDGATKEALTRLLELAQTLTSQNTE